MFSFTNSVWTELKRLPNRRITETNFTAQKPRCLMIWGQRRDWSLVSFDYPCLCSPDINEEPTTTVSSIPTSTESTELPITTTESSETTSTETESEFSTTMTTSTPERTTKTSSAETSKPTTSTEQTTTNYPDENSSTMPSILGGASAAFFLLLVAGTCYYKRTTVQRQWFLFKHRHDGRSFLSERKDSEVEFEYDAFVSFSEHDRPWVYSHLVPNLEFSKSSNISSEASGTDHIAVYKW